MGREPITWVEVDDEICTRTFGVGGCTASLGGNVVRKCYGTFATCPVKSLFSSSTRTLRYCEPRPNLPPGGPVMFPVLKSVSEISGTVNIAGTDGDMSAFGRRATVKVELAEFPHHDIGVDPYAQQRMSGAAQIDEPGYSPVSRGGHFGKMRARSPYYTGRALRVVSAYLDGGVISDRVTRHYVQTERTVSDDGASVTIEAKDILDLADNEKAQAPAPSKGALADDISASDTNATLVPAGIGNADYPASGRAVIGSEIVRFTRSGDVLTFVERGASGTSAASHSAADTVQRVLFYDGNRIDAVLLSLLRDYAKIPEGFLDQSGWAAEVSRWMPQLLLRASICKPTGVASLVGELAVLGVSIWWDEVAQKVRMQANRPPDEGGVIALNDDANILSVEVEDRQKDRLTEVMFYTVQIDPTKSATSADNYRRCAMTVATDAKGPNAYGDTKVRKIFCRWLDQGADSVVLTLSNRLLNRFAVAPVRVVLTLDAKDRAIGLADVLSVTSSGVLDETGKPVATLLQVVRRSEPDRGHRVEITAQAFQFSGRYAYATENGRPTYAASTAAQRARGMYACGNSTLKMSNGDEPYRAV